MLNQKCNLSTNVILLIVILSFTSLIMGIMTGIIIERSHYESAPEWIDQP